MTALALEDSTLTATIVRCPGAKPSLFLNDMQVELDEGVQIYGCWNATVAFSWDAWDALVAFVEANR